MLDETIVRAVVVGAWLATALIALFMLALDPTNAVAHALALGLSMFMAGKEI